MDMRIVTINIPDSYLEAIKVLVNMGFYSNRSQIVRLALQDFLEKEKKFTREIAAEEFKKLKELQLKIMKEREKKDGERKD